MLHFLLSSFLPLQLSELFPGAVLRLWAEVTIAALRVAAVHGEKVRKVHIINEGVSIATVSLCPVGHILWFSANGKRLCLSTCQLRKRIRLS